MRVYAYGLHVKIARGIRMITQTEATNQTLAPDPPLPRNQRFVENAMLSMGTLRFVNGFRGEGVECNRFQLPHRRLILLALRAFRALKGNSGNVAGNEAQIASLQFAVFHLTIE
jgi:hypothetical protein